MGMAARDASLGLAVLAFGLAACGAGSGAGAREALAGTWHAEDGEHPFSNEARCVERSGSRVGCLPTLRAAPEDADFDLESASVLGGVGAVFVSENGLSITYRGGFTLRRTQDDPANPDTLYVIVVLDHTNESDEPVHLRHGTFRSLRLQARSSPHSSLHSRNMTGCGPPAVPYEGIVEPGETITREYCWTSGAPTGWLDGEPYVLVEGRRDEFVVLAAVEEFYPDEVRQDIRESIERMSAVSGRDPAENGLEAWERRYSGGQALPDAGELDDPGTDAAAPPPPPPPPPPAPPSAPSPSPTEPPAAAEPDPPAEAPDPPGPSRTDAGGVPVPDDETVATQNPLEAATALLTMAYGIEVPWCEDDRSAWCFDFLHEFEHEAVVRVVAEGETQAFALFEIDRATPAGSVWWTSDMWRPGQGAAPTWAEPYV